MELSAAGLTATGAQKRDEIRCVENVKWHRKKFAKIWFPFHSAESVIGFRENIKIVVKITENIFFLLLFRHSSPAKSTVSSEHEGDGEEWRQREILNFNIMFSQ